MYLLNKFFSKFLFPKSGTYGKNTFTDTSVLKELILKELKILGDEYSKLDLNNPTYQIPMFAGAMSLALCYINRFIKEKPHIKPRILVIQVSPDPSSQYIPVMNCIFSAQKQFIPVDACVLASQDSGFLQQAVHITGGIYLKPALQNGLAQYLLTCFLADHYARKYLTLPSISKVDYRASCFCHKKVIDIGYVCSVCLSIFCDFSPVCSTCGAKFAIPKLKKLPPLKKKRT